LVTTNLNISKTSWYIPVVVVDKKYRRKGIASKLLNHTFDYLKKNFYARKIFLIVDCNNESAINLYKNLGFKKYSTNCLMLLKKPLIFMDKVKILGLKRKDSTHWKELYKLAIKVNPKTIKIEGMTKEDFKENIYTILQKTKNSILKERWYEFVIEHDHRIVGFFSIRLLKNEKKLYLNKLIISPDYIGLTKKLIKKLFTISGVEMILINVSSIYEKILKKLGFKIIKKRYKMVLEL
jgi:N-acetylglutamate synthase-like GNAT family acetyltransferase